MESTSDNSQFELLSFPLPVVCVEKEHKNNLTMDRHKCDTSFADRKQAGFVDMTPKNIKNTMS